MKMPWVQGVEMARARTGWRLALAADLLREPDATIGAVARQVGYGSSFALSTAFKRVHGMSPQEHRRAVTTGTQVVTAQSGTVVLPRRVS
ncbi:hypothetical protein KALB_6550 [Kutzneria albida DSM 43870]|uniref:HTH araC/xylS-type domain-containing protein n=1 Tax=Kutzneria albida DSM 43870 TaxID=1449976 RepID=W5WP08_9PSEU|nr:hypothetical protein KALB_6550 [Kutzneria albida DSM 43870]